MKDEDVIKEFLKMVKGYNDELEKLMFENKCDVEITCKIVLKDIPTLQAYMAAGDEQIEKFKQKLKKSFIGIPNTKISVEAKIKDKFE